MLFQFYKENRRQSPHKKGLYIRDEKIILDNLGENCIGKEKRVCIPRNELFTVVLKSTYIILTDLSLKSL